MATNFVFKEADYISLPVPTGTKAGKPLRIGALNAVTVTAEGSVTETITLGAGASLVQPSGAASGNEPGYASVALKGSAILDVTGITVPGTPVYIKTSDNTLQVTAAAGTKLFGVALAAKTAPVAGVHVKILNGGIVADAA
jgi:predicted RecA/RadA family phage recombinase